MAATKILIVEDEDMIAEDMANQLTQAGYEITTWVDSCEKAIQAVESNQPDIVFLDISIAGGIDGIDTAKQLKAMDNSLIIIFLTNLHDEKILKRALEVAPASYLYKPFTQEQLHASIQTALCNIADKKEKVLEGNQEIAEMVIQNKLYLKDNSGVYRKYFIDDILYIEAERAYCNIYTSKGILTQSVSMGGMSEKINHPKLIRVHRSHIVNIDNVSGVKGNILLIGEKETPVQVSEQYKDTVFRLLPLIK